MMALAAPTGALKGAPKGELMAALMAALAVCPYLVMVSATALMALTAAPVVYPYQVMELMAPAAPVTSSVSAAAGY